VVIEDSGHPVNIDQPDRLNEVLLEFLGGLGQPDHQQADTEGAPA
jgi:hypothetical protein